MNKIRIGLCGKQKSGKDTAANYLKQEYGGTIFHIAQGVYNTTELLLGYKFIGKKISMENKTDFERTCLQRVGEYGRKIFGKDIWLKQAASLLNKLEGNVYITGVRFPNEVEFLQSLGVKCIWIDRSEQARIKDGAFNLYHETETALDNYDGFDAVLNNNGSIAGLKLQIQKIINPVKVSL